MNLLVRDGISYSGISDYIPNEITSFEQRNTDKVITINQKLPNIDDILKVSISKELENSNVAKTATGVSLEGQSLSGYKLLTEGKFVVRIDYCSESNNGCIYTFKEVIYFNNATTIPKDKGQGSRVVEDVYIEDIYVEKISERDLIVNISFIFAIEDY